MMNYDTANSHGTINVNAFTAWLQTVRHLPTSQKNLPSPQNRRLAIHVGTGQ